jgi:hypothetical protein
MGSIEADEGGFLVGLLARSGGRRGGSGGCRAGDGDGQERILLVAWGLRLCCRTCNESYLSETIPGDSKNHQKATRLGQMPQYRFTTFLDATFRRKRQFMN